jgi:Signal transduction histidine kinase involved in nitrogen fixation and metabolism regulation
MAPAALKSWRFGAWAVVLLMLLLLFALHFLSGAVLGSESLSRWFIPLLVFTVAGLLVLSSVVIWNLFLLLRDYWRNRAGARLMARLVVLFVVLGIAPAGIVYYYSLQFLMQGIDSWFDVQIDSAMEDALQLNQATLNLTKKLLLRYSEQMLDNIEDSSRTGLTLTLSELRVRSGATELALATLQGKILAAAHVDPEVLVPTAPDPLVLQQVVSGEPYAGFVNYGEEAELQIQVLVADLSRGLVLQAIFPTSARIGELSKSVQQAYVAYRERAYLRESIKFSFMLALSLVLLVSVVAAIWSAFHTSRRLVAPIRAIADGTRAIAEGERGRPHSRAALSRRARFPGGLLQRHDPAPGPGQGPGGEEQAAAGVPARLPRGPAAPPVERRHRPRRRGEHPHRQPGRFPDPGGGGPGLRRQAARSHGRGPSGAGALRHPTRLPAARQRRGVARRDPARATRGAPVPHVRPHPPAGGGAERDRLRAGVRRRHHPGAGAA